MRCPRTAPLLPRRAARGLQEGLAAALLVTLALSSSVAQPLRVAPTTTESPRGATACPPRPRCQFRDPTGENTYIVTENTLSRSMRGTPTWTRPLATGQGARVLLSNMNADHSQLVVLVGTESVGVGSLFSPGSLRPDQVQRQYTVSLRNPKSGDEIKAIDLGPFKPGDLGLSPPGDYLWMVGEELQLRRREVRAYNTRSGAMEHQLVVERRAEVALHASGYRMGTITYAAEAPSADWTVRRHASSNPYSIAEFTARKGTPLSPHAVGDVAVIGFSAPAAVKDLLDGTLMVKLAGHGLRLVERQRIKELLQEAQFQNLGLTDSRSAAELGKLANARFLVFGTLQTAGSVTTLALRLVDVESGTVSATIDLECRDCRPDDYGQAVGFLVDDWIDR